MKVDHNPEDSSLKSKRESRPSRRVVDAALAAWGRSGRESVVPITGHSMWPLLRSGDEALVRLGPAGIRPGDIVAFRLENQLTVHRVLAVRRREGAASLLTAGDNNAGFDPEIPLDQVVGKVIAVRRQPKIMRLDTISWRLSGYILARLWLGGRRAQKWVRRARRRWGKAEEGRASSRTGRRSYLIRSRQTVLSLLERAVGRWRA